ncbi:hypothetical protein H7097_00745 [Aeromicrobium sp.]|nr:hypothetical protein [Candidatus Saccharibacteria bacterium]
MKSVFILLIVVIVVAIAAGIVVVRRQGTHACITYYTKDGQRELSKTCQ